MEGELMTDWLLLLFRDLSFTIWLGGLIAIDCIEAPARFRTPELTRAQLVAVGRQVFAAFNRAEILLGIFTSVSSLLLISHGKDEGFITMLATKEFPEFSVERHAKYGDFVILTDGRLPRRFQAEESPRK